VYDAACGSKIVRCISQASPFREARLLEVSHMAYTKVAQGAAPAALELRTVNEGVNAFLADHISALRQLTSSRKTQPGRFIDPDAQALFRGLCSDQATDFLAAADTLTKRLIGTMDGRTTPGLLICLRSTDGSGLVAGVMKLQVTAEHGAVLESLDSGEVLLSAVTKILDKPGDLQKGALVTSSLADDRVLTGDRLQHDAAYFPRAFGIQPYARPSESVGQFLQAVEAVVPDLVASTAAALPSIAPGEPPKVLAALGQQLPELTAQRQADVAGLLENQPRPVGVISTRRPSRQTLKIGDITVSGPTSAMQQYARVQHVGAQHWQVIVDGDEQPTRNFS